MVYVEFKGIAWGCVGQAVALRLRVSASGIRAFGCADLKLRDLGGGPKLGVPF